jgi:hypothetical protein
MADQPRSAGAGFAVRDEALAQYAREAGRIATDLSGFAQRELPTARALPADAFGPLAHTCGFTPALVTFCGRATDTAHAIGATVRSIESGVDATRQHYRAAEQGVAAGVAAQS